MRTTGAGRPGEPDPDGTQADGSDPAAWFAAVLPAEWRGGPPTVEVDNDEILVIVHLPDPPPGSPGGGSFGPGDQARIEWFRAQTRDERMALAADAEARFGRKVSWGACAGEMAATFTMSSVPVMTRLRMPERRVLDTLIDAGVARSRSEALAWCVRLVGDNEKEWIARLRDAFAAVEAVRDEGPAARRRG
ncbi:hypothetical protein K6U06_07775 [Acidiferrimicrobium sp. IK]|uniref:hypothetical protein n=1 Tax=Acidiferrimicrobium sp. IK TaxID=2871700 RepID=UPI0021CB1546|nr:hypothetical protein [Acidiferrimicrobium sp. IK]MCU4184256.1 hypothetical protein [Acidiferrimicrobium sp. IK]